MRHVLKAWPEPFAALRNGSKTHETRREDRPSPFAVGDQLVVWEWLPDTEEKTGRYVVVEVTYLSRGPDWGIRVGMVVMSVKLQWTGQVSS